MFLCLSLLLFIVEMNKRPRCSVTPTDVGSVTQSSANPSFPESQTDLLPSEQLSAGARRISHSGSAIVADVDGDAVGGSPQRHRENVPPPSPASNRDRFRASLMPSQVTCDLSNVTVEPGHRFTFQGIVLVVFPSSSNPLRRHLLVGDGRGVVGITVWNALVNLFSSVTHPNPSGSWLL